MTDEAIDLDELERLEREAREREAGIRGYVPEITITLKTFAKITARLRFCARLEPFLREHGDEVWNALSLQDGAEQAAAFEAFEKLLEAFGLDSTGAPC